jgi:hypothetical protein
VFANRKWAQFALILNLAGTVALFYSFQATSSNFRLVTAMSSSAFGTSEQSALCVYGHAMMTANKAGGWSVGGGRCPDWEHSRAAAVVNIEHPTFEGLGFVLLLAGFLIQLLAVPSPATIVQIKTGDEADQETGETPQTPLAPCGSKLTHYLRPVCLACGLCYS